MGHAKTSLIEALLGLVIGVVLAFVIAVVMDRFHVVYKMTYPLLVITQAIPAVAIAPLLVLWLGYDMTPKVVLVIIVCFFPVAVGLLDGLRAADADQISLLRAMGANRAQIFWHIKLPGAMPSFFFRAKNFRILLHRGGGHSGMARRQQRAWRIYDPCAQVLRV